MDNTFSYEKLPQSFYIRNDVVQIAKDLLGKYLFTNIGGNLTAAKIVETEAYNGRTDRACHAFNRRTVRTETMYQQGGIAYVYLCYGIHHLFNVVTNREGLADAVLVRGVEPVYNLPIMQERRGKPIRLRQLTAGPGTLSKALGITRSLNGIDLSGDTIWLAQGVDVKEVDMVAATRIGVDYAGDDALLPWRFYVRGSAFVSVKSAQP